MKSLTHWCFYSKRNISKNISTGIWRKNITIRCCLLFLAVSLTVVPCLTSCKSEKQASVKRSQKDKAKKDKEAQKKYEAAIKQHEKNQSATTRAMMKKSKKDQPKNTPLRKASGKKCKQ